MLTLTKIIEKKLDVDFWELLDLNYKQSPMPPRFWLTYFEKTGATGFFVYKDQNGVPKMTSKVVSFRGKTNKIGLKDLKYIKEVNKVNLTSGRKVRRSSFTDYDFLLKTMYMSSKYDSIDFYTEFPNKIHNILSGKLLIEVNANFIGAIKVY